MALNDKAYVNSFMHGRERVRKLIISAMVCALLSLAFHFFLPSGSTLFGGATLILLLASVVFLLKECRCPYCGKRIIFGVLAVTACPRCRRNLTTGKKTKKSK